MVPKKKHRLSLVILWYCIDELLWPDIIKTLMFYPKGYTNKLEIPIQSNK